MRETTEVALNDGAGCDGRDDAQINPGLDAAVALAALRHLARIARGTATATFTCAEAGRSHRCDSPASIRRALASPARLATGDAATIEVSLDVTDGMVTTARWQLAVPDRIAVRRRLVPPF